MQPADTFGLVGTTIAEKYSVEAVADAGGTAVVYRAFHLLWRRLVALKVFRTPAAIDDEARASLLERFVLEGRLLAELSERSSAVLQARDIGTLTTEAGEWVPYMVLEWLEGATLERTLEREAAAQLPMRDLVQAVALLDPIVVALGLAHRRGIVHRDVKPSNLFVVGEGADATLKLLDFGIAKVVEDARDADAYGRTGEHHLSAFTPAYGAPEQFSRALGTTGPWTDVFALALVLLEIVSGRAPLPGDTIEELGRASTNLSLRPSLARYGKTHSSEVEAVFARAVTVEPSRRYGSVEVFWADLRRALVPSADSSRALEATLGATLPRSELPRQSSRARWALAFGAIVVVVAGTAVLALRSPTAPVQAPRTAVVAAPASAPLSAPVCPDGMLLVPASTYFMGSDEKDVEEDERPAHKVRLDAYCMDRTEVTTEAFAACVARGACAGAWDANDWPGIAKKDRATFDPLCNAREPTRRGSHPANCVSWEQARDYCAARGARLPAEAEWELAARGTDGRRYPWGDAEPTSSRLNACGAECVAWGKKHGVVVSPMYRDDDGWPSTAPVGTFPAGASPYGMLDMTGNVWEWVSDRHGAYGAGESRNPTGPTTGDDRVLRGGAWNGAESAWVRPTYRFHASPAMRSHGIGFRCAKTL
jgi:eukaryotic-like serine/threonine-protein kinase